MKSRIFMVAAMIGLMATSCTKEIEDMPVEVKQMPLTITANYGGDNSKVAYTESGNSITATWQSGDKIYVVYDGYVSELSLTSGAGTDNGTFEGRISYRATPTANSILGCYVKDQNNASAVTIDGDNVVYSDAAFQSQDATLAGAAKCNTYFGMATYGDGTNVRCHFSVNTSMCKFTLKDIVVDAQNDATLEYTSGSTTVAMASWSEQANDNLVYLAIPAGSYSGEQKVTYTCGATVKEFTLSASEANFLAGHTYSKSLAKVLSIALNKTSTTLNAGNTETLRVNSVLPNYANDRSYTWSSLEPSIATVNQNGVVTAVATGTAHIRATANDGSGVYGECTVTVTSAQIGHALSAAAVGEFICNDSKAYASADNLPSGVHVVAKVAYKSGSHGLALALRGEDEIYGTNWNSAMSACSGMNSSTPISGATWGLPSMDQWYNMINAAGGCVSLRESNNLSDLWYWSSTPNEDSYDPGIDGYREYRTYDFDGCDGETWSDDGFDEDIRNLVRACLAF